MDISFFESDAFLIGYYVLTVGASLLLIKDTKKPLINKPVAGLYPPGSTIKPIVALSALENDVISPKLVVECRGNIEFHGATYHCWKEKGHGFMDLRNGIKQSCDIYFYEVARRLGIDRVPCHFT